MSRLSAVSAAASASAACSIRAPAPHRGVRIYIVEDSSIIREHLVASAPVWLAMLAALFNPAPKER